MKLNVIIYLKFVYASLSYGLEEMLTIYLSIWKKSKVITINDPVYVSLNQTGVKEKLKIFYVQYICL